MRVAKLFVTGMVIEKLLALVKFLFFLSFNFVLIFLWLWQNGIRHFFFCSRNWYKLVRESFAALNWYSFAALNWYRMSLIFCVDFFRELGK